MVRKRLQRWLPSEEALRTRRSLRWLGPLLRRPWLWQLSRRRVAAGAAIGVFFGFLTPVLQIALAAVVTILLRANLPVAAVATLVSNPFTYVPIFAAAYQTGSMLIGQPVDKEQAAAVTEKLGDSDVDTMTWSKRAQAVGKPLFVGLAVFAVVGALITWVAVNLLWIFAVRLRRRRTMRAAAREPPGD
jgi:uncharacterized protein (DUF2062 family)